MLSPILLATLTGTAGHFTHPFIEKKFGNGWRQMASHTLGVSITAPFFYWFCRVLGVGEFAENLTPLERIKEEGRQRQLVMLAFFAAFFCVGIGTLIGWTLEPTKEAHHK